VNTFVVNDGAISDEVGSIVADSSDTRSRTDVGDSTLRSANGKLNSSERSLNGEAVRV